MKAEDNTSFDKQIYYRLIALWVLKSQSDINQVVLMLPSVKYIFLKSWQLSSPVKGCKRIPIFL